MRHSVSQNEELCHLVVDCRFGCKIHSNRSIFAILIWLFFSRNALQLASRVTRTLVHTLTLAPDTQISHYASETDGQQDVQYRPVDAILLAGKAVIANRIFHASHQLLMADWFHHAQANSLLSSKVTSPTLTTKQWIALISFNKSETEALFYWRFR